MNSIRTIVFSGMAFLFVFSCQSDPVNFEGGNPNPAPALEMAQLKSIPDEGLVNDAESYDKEFGTDLAVSTSERKIIKDGSIIVVVKDIDHAKSGIDSLTKKYKAYYSNESFNNTDYEHNYYLTIRIPTDHLEVFITEIESGIGEVINKNITTRDVTEEFIDLETRLKNKQHYLNRYNEILKQAKTIKDILEIQQRTREIEEEIESVKGRLKYLNSQVNYSTLSVQISKRNEIFIDPSQGNFIKRLKSAIIKGWHGLVSFTLFIIRIWPFWIIVGALFYVVRRIWKRKKK